MNKKQLSIRAYIRQIVILGVVILILFLELSSVISIQKGFAQDTKEVIILETSSGAEFIDNWLAKKVAETELISESVKAMKSFTDDEAQAFLTSYADLDSDVLNYYLCREGIPYVVYNGGTFDLDPTGRSWWSDAWSAGKTIITDAYVDANSGQIVVSVATPFYFGDVKSIILADITMDTLIGTLQSLSNENMSVFLTDSNGGIIVHKNSSYLMGSDGSSTNINDVYKLSLNTEEVQEINDDEQNAIYLATKTVEHNGWVVGAYIPKDYMAKRIIKAVLFGVVVAFIICCLSIAYFVILLKKELAPMEEMKHFVKDVVVGGQNVPAFRKEKDEITFLIGELREKFVETIRKTKAEMSSIDGNIQNTNSSVGDIVDAVNSISSVIEETAASMDTQTSNISNINNDCSTISNASIAVAEQAQEMAEKSSAIVGKITQLTSKMQADKEATETSCNISRKKLDAAIKEAECIREITNISDAIRNIASQTNLLSLNASIESARAGESGRGFAVVAEEIRSLSDETSKEINKISDLADRLLEAVKTLSKESLDSMDNLSEDIRKAYDAMEWLASEYVESAEYFSSVSSELGASSEELSASVQAVANSIEDISSSQNEVNLAMDNASRNIQSVALEAVSMKSKVESVSSAVVEVTQTVQQFNV